MAKSLPVILLGVFFAVGPAAANWAADTPHPLTPPDTRTIYQTPDGGLTGDRVEAVEGEVRSWCSICQRPRYSACQRARDKEKSERMPRQGEIAMHWKHIPFKQRQTSNIEESRQRG